jgi:hypothetical protein
MPVKIPLVRLLDIVFRITRANDGPGDIAPIINAIDSASHCSVFIGFVWLLFCFGNLLFELYDYAIDLHLRGIWL